MPRPRKQHPRELLNRQRNTALSDMNGHQWAEFIVRPPLPSELTRGLVAYKAALRAEFAVFVEERAKLFDPEVRKRLAAEMYLFERAIRWLAQRHTGMTWEQIAEAEDRSHREVLAKALPGFSEVELDAILTQENSSPIDASTVRKAVSRLERQMGTK
jgi:hypothetical protein